ncbi:ABC transporter G family member 37-like isoform X2 [Daucus carota subsp. sativus]|uniref:ABC transporter G family member 37-like isoform X2 n=1 Tax=Daucus carota subsp. sativus TaxID=79200 RepID=UPI003083C647
MERMTSWFCRILLLRRLRLRLKTLISSRRSQTLIHLKDSPNFKQKNTRAVFPFKPMTITFENVQYFVDTPKKMREKGYQQRFSITGSFQPAVLTALMGVMQLLSGSYI